jgi:hypothetical protein
MSRLSTSMLLAVLLISTADAAPADWKSYLCRYGDKSAETVQLVKVNEKDGRVTINDKDTSGVRISADEIAFDGPRGLPWYIAKNDNRMTAMDRYGIVNGQCKIVDD